MESPKVLIVEDEGIVARDLQRTLVNLGYAAASWAATGEEGVEIAGKDHPDLVLMDIHLGKGMNGIEAATKIRDRFNTPVIFLTAYSDTPTLEMAKRSQPYGYILKPFDENELRTNIEVALYKHRMEKELIENRRFLSHLISQFPGFVYRCRRKGKMPLTFISEGISRVSGYSPEELLDRSSGSWDKVKHPDDRDRVLKEIRAADEGGRDFEIEYRILGRDGEIRWVLEKGHRVEVGGEFELEGYVTDITGRKKTEEVLSLHNKLEGIGRLAGGIAHEFNNYLMAVISGLFLVKEDAGRGTEIFQRAEMLEKESERARLLTQRLLTFARGGQPLVGRTSVLALIRETSRLVLQGSKTVSVISAPENLWDIEADEGQIGEAFHSILENAAEAMDDGGTIRVEAGNVENTPDQKRELKAGKYVEIKFCDEGEGIPPNDRDKIFEPFFTTKGSHSGLGLSAAYSIIKNHQGVITIDSNGGRGTVFSVFLPAFSVKEKKGSPQATGIAAGKRILLMDDEPYIQTVLREILSHMGFEVESSADGEEAVRLYRESKKSGRPFDCVILDLTVSNGMGGEAAADLIRKFDPGARLIASSGYSKSPVMGNYRNFGFRGILPKPYSAEDLEKVLGRILSD